MKKKLFLSLLATAMLFAACGDSNDEATPEGKEPEEYKCGTYIKGSVIDKFYEPKKLDVDFLSPTQGFDYTLFSIYTISYSELKDPANRWLANTEKGQEYVKYYEDTTYSGWLSFTDLRYEVSAMPLNSINVTTNKDFDSEHPAGSSLNDIFTLEYASAYELIQSNYDPNLNFNLTDKYQEIALSEFKASPLLFYHMYLYFNKLPEKLGTYEFTITFNYGKDPISGREAKVAPAVVKAEFTEKDYVALPKH
ncbi:MAG: hypothetical protein MJZ66_10305 [Bacteroidales bacterium]|nr:hypothetical protein [Bacteroidales bacterium]